MVLSASPGCKLEAGAASMHTSFWALRHIGCLPPPWMPPAQGPPGYGPQLRVEGARPEPGLFMWMGVWDLFLCLQGSGVQVPKAHPVASLLIGTEAKPGA